MPEKDRPGYTLSLTRKRLIEMQAILDFNIPALYRRSSGGHVHVKLLMPQEVSVLDAFMVRAWFYDDRQRLTLDMRRYLETGSLHKMNRCFDHKATYQGVKTAGPWIDINVDRDKISGEALEDLKKYLDSQKVREQIHPPEKKKRGKRKKDCGDNRGNSQIDPAR